MAAQVCLKSRLSIGNDIHEAQALQDETAQAEVAQLSFQGVYDLQPAILQLLENPGSALHPLQMNGVASTLQTALEQCVTITSALPALERHTRSVDVAALQSLVAAIRFAIDPKTGDDSLPASASIFKIKYYIFWIL